MGVPIDCGDAGLRPSRGVIVRILHKADLYQLLVSTTDLEFGVLFRRLE